LGGYPPKQFSLLKPIEVFASMRQVYQLLPFVQYASAMQLSSLTQGLLLFYPGKYFVFIPCDTITADASFLRLSGFLKLIE